MKIEIPTILSNECIQHFRKLYRKYYGVDLTVEQANKEANRIMTIMAIVIENTN